MINTLLISMAKIKIQSYFPSICYRSLANHLTFWFISIVEVSVIITVGDSKVCHHPTKLDHLPNELINNKIDILSIIRLQ